jgi:hypothetical protein
MDERIDGEVSEDVAPVGVDSWLAQAALARTQFVVLAQKPMGSGRTMVWA